MSCDEAEVLMHGHLDGELDLVRNLDLEKHAQGCQHCAKLMQRQVALRSAVRNASLYFAAPENLRRRVQVALRHEVKQPWWSRWLGNRLSLAGALAVSVAAIAIAIWSIAAFRARTSAEQLLAQEIVSSHVRSLMVDHLMDVQSSDQHTVKPWFEGKLDFSPPVKDLSNQGTRLLGGRLEYLANRSVAALVYQRRQHFINLYLWPGGENPPTAEKPLTRQGYNLTHWVSDGMTYWAISDLDADELRDFARAQRS